MSSFDVENGIIKHHLQTQKGRDFIASTMIQPNRHKITYRSLYPRCACEDPKGVPFGEPVRTVVEFHATDHSSFMVGQVKFLTEVVHNTNKAVVDQLGTEREHCPDVREFLLRNASLEGRILMSASTFKLVYETASDIIDIETHENMIKTGLRGMVVAGRKDGQGGQNILTADEITDNVLYFVLSKQGRFVESDDSQAMDEPGWFRLSHQLSIEVVPHAAVRLKPS